MDHDDEDYELDDDGRPRKKRVFRSGDTLAFRMEWQDHIPMTDMAGTVRAASDTARVTDGVGNLAGHRPGHCFAIDADPLRAKADQEYEAAKKRSREAYLKGKGKTYAPHSKLIKRNKGGVTVVPKPRDGSDNDGDRAHDNRERTLDQLTAARDAAWKERKNRAANAWKEKSR
jgi:hypothetical protein